MHIEKLFLLSTNLEYKRIKIQVSFSDDNNYTEEISVVADHVYDDNGNGRGSGETTMRMNSRTTHYIHNIPSKGVINEESIQYNLPNALLHPDTSTKSFTVDSIV